jgi:Flp pilus assembly pilin Flp
MRWIEQGWLTAARCGAGWSPPRDQIGGGFPGQSTVEYALVGALVVIAAAGALTILGSELNTVFTNISRTLGAAAGR